ncbi:hybrid sensor histidine kinase/response regulator [Alphaproteobacteria bacterium]|nr:hybrid sensor histidine kinase/response regulator [Alphaproteobacteria bacterium]GHS98567.1 hybrid sensor histidine kinase/response regulator [Alphaproteobacteria bacterium]
MQFFLLSAQVVLTLSAFFLGQLFESFTPLAKVFFSLAFLGIFLGVALVAWRFFQHAQKMHKRSLLARSLLTTLSEVDEIIVLDAHSKVVYAKHWSKDEPVPEFFDFHALMGSQFVDHDHALAACQDALRRGHYFDDVFQTIKNNDWEEDNFIRLRVLPLYAFNSQALAYKALVLSNVTLYYPKDSVSNFVPSRSFESSALEQGDLLKNYAEMAPFGLIFVNKKGEILSLNETAKNWLGPQKDSFVGKLFPTLLNIAPEGFEEILKRKTWSLLRIQKNKIDHPFFFLSSYPITSDCFVLSFLKKEHVSKISEEDILQNIPVPSVGLDVSGKIQSFNTPFKMLFQKDAEKSQDSSLKEGDSFLELLDESSQKNLKEILATGGPFNKVFELRFWTDRVMMGYLKKWDSQTFLFHFFDISDQKKLEQQFIQAQKTQAMGQLAGGIVHDFNNLLTAIIGFSDLLLQRVMPNDPSFTDLMHIKQNANRASNLVKQLLAFSRRQSLQLHKTQLTDILSDLSVLLRRLIGPQIQLKIARSRNLWPIKVDIGQLEQVIINLTVNARDAMKNGGELVIESSNYTNAVPKAVGKDWLPTGDYVLIGVTDTGCGIAPEFIKSVFEPFFSTKEAGTGTGIGLATAYSIIHQAGGVIDVESQVNVGTTFQVFLPRCMEPDEIVKPAPKAVRDVTGQETILLVEDEDAVRTFASRALRNKGYRVLEAADGEGALDFIQKGETPQLLLTDVSMPGMDGPTLQRKICDSLPKISTLFMSGYAEETLRENLGKEESHHFLLKPFTLRDLALKVREVLG